MLTEYLKRRRSGAIFDIECEPPRKVRLLSERLTPSQLTDSNCQSKTKTWLDASNIPVSERVPVCNVKRKWHCIETLPVDTDDVNCYVVEPCRKQRRGGRRQSDGCQGAQDQLQVERQARLYEEKRHRACLLMNLCSQAQGQESSICNQKQSILHRQTQPCCQMAHSRRTIESEFNSFNFWRPPLPNIAAELQNLSTSSLPAQPPSTLVLPQMDSSCSPAAVQFADSQSCIVPMQSPEFSSFNFWKSPVSNFIMQL